MAAVREFKFAPEDCQIIATALNDYAWRHEGLNGGEDLAKRRDAIRRLHDQFNQAAGVTLEEVGGETTPGIEEAS